MSLDRLRRALLSQRSPGELLTNKRSRELLIDLLRPEELALLGRHAGVSGRTPAETLSALLAGSGRSKLKSYVARPCNTFMGGRVALTLRAAWNSLCLSSKEGPSFSLWDRSEADTRRCYVFGLMDCEQHRP